MRQHVDRNAMIRLFQEIRDAFPHLSMRLDTDPPNVDLNMDIPRQPGLAFDVNLNLQGDELHLHARAFWLEWFSCTRPEIVETYRDAVHGLLSRQYRIVEHYRGTRAFKAQLQSLDGEEWQTIGTSWHGWPWPFPRRVVQKVLQNIVVVAVAIALGSGATGCVTHRAPGQARPSGAVPPSRRLLDGKQWTIRNLNVALDGSYCYQDSDANCRRYGRLYTWTAAGRACRSIGGGWRLPSNDEWQRLASHYGGVRGDAKDAGKAAFTALSSGGRSGFNALLGGVRRAGGEYARLDAHGFFWTASESKPGRAWFYNFGRGGQALNRHEDGDQRIAISVRCIRD